MTHLTQRIIVTYATRNPQPQQIRGPCNPSAPARCHTRNILLDRLTCFLTSAMYIITVLLLVSLCLASGQRTDVPLDSCTYSFVVQSPHCWRGGNTGWESEVAILKETVASLSDRLEGWFRVHLRLHYQLCRCGKVYTTRTHACTHACTHARTQARTHTTDVFTIFLLQLHSLISRNSIRVVR